MSSSSAVQLEEKPPARERRKYFLLGACAALCCFLALALAVSLAITLSTAAFFYPYLCRNGIEALGASRVAQLANGGSNVLFRDLNFVDGLKHSEVTGENTQNVTWNPPVAGEEVEVVLFEKVASFRAAGITDKYYTAARVPSWEFNEAHDSAVAMIRTSLGLGGSAFWDCYVGNQKTRRPIHAHDELMRTSWTGFAWFGYRQIEYASNGDHGYPLLTSAMSANAAAGGSPYDALGPLVSASALGMHLRYDSSSDTFSINLEDMSDYRPIDGFSRLGGAAIFRAYGNTLRTVSISYGGNTWTPGDAQQDAEVALGLADNKWVGWKRAEKLLLASLLAQTNLVLHVTLVHLELAAVFQVNPTKARGA